MSNQLTLESAPCADTLPDVDAESIAAVAKALAHPARVSIIRVLLSRPGCIGGDIVEEVGLAQSTVSEHLRILKASGLVIGTIERPRICYSLNPSVLAPLHSLVRLIETRDTNGGDAPCCYTAEGCLPMESSDLDETTDVQLSK